jgi:predicted TIM-barrel enzyme
MLRRRIPFSLAERGPGADWHGAADAAVIVCPWLKGLPAESGLWMSALPIHDANEFVGSGAAIDAGAAPREQVYVGIFALDRFRPTAQLFAALRAMGVRRLINLPSVSFFDGRSGAMLEEIELGPAREVDFLLQARDAGFRIALCTTQARASKLADVSPFDFLLIHEGPGRPLVAYAQG